MSEKRRDHRGRILHNGEIQLSDGRYRFKYVDERKPTGDTVGRTPNNEEKMSELGI